MLEFPYIVEFVFERLQAYIDLLERMHVSSVLESLNIKNIHVKQ